MKHYTLILLLIGYTFQLVAQEKFNPDEQLKLLTGKKENIGLTAGYSIDGVIKWSGSEGYLCEDNETPFSTTTLTRIASIAKSFTAVAIMQLTEKGDLTLDAPINQYLTNLPEDKKQITVKQLLAHTAGISQYMGEEEIENTTHYATLQDAMNVFIDRPLLFKPGSKYFYTTYGYVILGRIIEMVSGMSYQEYMRKNIFEIAEMDNTDVEKINQNYPNKSCIYNHNGRKAKEGNQNDLSNRIPGGGFYSTLEDVMKFGNALVSGKLIFQGVLGKNDSTRARYL